MFTLDQTFTMINAVVAQCLTDCHKVEIMHKISTQMYNAGLISNTTFGRVRGMIRKAHGLENPIK